MFKGFQNKSRQFNGFPNLNFQVNNEAYGFSGCKFWLDAAYGTNTQTNLAAVSSWTDKISNTTFTQETAGNQPRYNSSNILYNNLPTIESQGNTRRLENTTGFPLGKTVAFIANYNTISATINSVYSIYYTSNINPYGFFAVGGNSSGVNGVTFRDVNLTYHSGTTESTSVKIVVATPNAIYVNGVKESSSYNGIGNYSIGIILGNSTARNDSLQGHLAEIISWNNDYTGSETIISDRLNTKYAIY